MDAAHGNLQRPLITFKFLKLGKINGANGLIFRSPSIDLLLDGRANIF